jgi:outer membrane protein OmpA-like peptidoglycan-associated protein
LDADGRRAVVAAADSVKASDAPIAVTGYADPSGNPAQNLGLAKNRAAAVRDALVQEGVPESRVMMTPPAAVTGTGSPDEARRVEITLAEAGTATQR